MTDEKGRNVDPLDVPAKALYEREWMRVVASGTAWYPPVPWDQLPEAAREHWRDEAAGLMGLLATPEPPSPERPFTDIERSQ